MVYYINYVTQNLYNLTFPCNSPKPPYSGDAPLGKDGGDEGVGENCVNVTKGGRKERRDKKKGGGRGGGGAPTPPTLVMLHLGRVVGMKVWVRTVLMGQREKREGGGGRGAISL